MGWGRGSRSSKGKAAAAAAAAADADDAAAAAAAAAEFNGGAPLPRGSLLDADTGRLLVPVNGSDDSDQAALAAAEETDSVEEALAGNFSPEVVDEVRRYAKPEWDVEPSSLDPVDDLGTFYEYDFKLPPGGYDAVEAAKNIRLLELEELKAPPDPATASKIAARQALVAGKSGDDLRWMKHKAYYRGVQKIRAGKAAVAAAADADADDGPAPAQQQQPAHQQQQQQPHASALSLLSEEEVLAGVGEPSEWELGWTAPGYSQHPEVLQQLRSTFASGLGLPPYQTAAQEEAAAEEHWAAATAAAAAAAAAQQQAAAEREATIRAYLPHQAYTPQYLEQQRRQAVLGSHRRAKQQAFWLSLTVALSSSAVRWWRQQGGKKKQRRRPGQLQQGGGGGSSRHSSRPPTPAGVSGGGGLMRGNIPE